MKCISLLIFLFFSLVTIGQNLVPNPSFEEYYTCPQNVVGLANNDGEPFIKDWYSMSITPDYMNYCAGSSSFNYPTDNAWGYQEPYHGDGYVSILTKDNFINEREYIAIELQNPMEFGETYDVSFFVSDADGGIEEDIDCLSNNIGLRFLTNPPYYWINESDNFPLLPSNLADINFIELMEDSIGWTEVSGEILASDSFTHIVIGNHFDDENTLFVESGVDDGCLAMYYIDKVCVVKQGNNCEIPISITEFEIRVLDFQNFVQDELDLSNIDQYTMEEILIYDLSGELVLFDNSNNHILNTSSLNTGLYVLQVKFNDGLINNYKFIKQ